MAPAGRNPSQQANVTSRAAGPVQQITSPNTCSTSTTCSTYGAWQTELLTSLPGYFNDEDTSDVCILLGNDIIYAHKLVLQLNSSIIASQTDGNLIKGRLEVNLLDFSLHKDTVADILKSFYTGTIAIHNDNIKVVYKFAKSYTVTWLIEHTLTLFDRMIDHLNFTDILKFAHNIACNKLIEACLIRLNKPLIDTLVESGEWHKLDYTCIAAVVKSNSVSIPEIEMFELVCKWFESDPEARSRHIGELISKLRFHLIKKQHLIGRVYDWVSTVPKISDKTRLDLLITVNSHVKVPGIVTLPQPPPAAGNAGDRTAATPGSPAKRSTTDILHTIVHSVQNNTNTVCTTPLELLSVLRDTFARADSRTKQCVVEYISDHCLVGANNVTELLQLYTDTQHQNLALLCLQYLNMSVRVHLHHVRWEDIACATIAKLVPQITAGRQAYVLAECVMRWAQTHPKQSDNIRSLLATICYDNIPKQYIRDVLLPHVRVYLPDVTDLACSQHPSHRQTNLPTVTTRPCPPELYLLRPFDIFNKGYILSLDKRYVSSPLTISRSGKKKGDCTGGFVLYVKEAVLERYPVAATLNLEELRGIVERQSALQLMFLL